ncbi:MAG: hypothetical protein ACREPM_17655, partial [Gemmatimonadaceae bacterium]
MRHKLHWHIWYFLLALRATPAVAQQVHGSVTVSGGSATDVAGTTSRALTVAPALALTPDPRVAFGLGARLATRPRRARGRESP